MLANNVTATWCQLYRKVPNPKNVKQEKGNINENAMIMMITIIIIMRIVITIITITTIMITTTIIMTTKAIIITNIIQLQLPNFSFENIL